MSELISNRQKQREVLKDIIRRLHAGEEAAALKGEFRALLDHVDATEIAEMESELIRSGLPEEEVKLLCDVHVAVFEDALNQGVNPDTVPGHPVHSFRLENDAIADVVKKTQAHLEEATRGATGEALSLLRDELQDDLHQLREMEKHYLRKENLLFPYLEKHGVTGPSSVMWALHDDIRADWKTLAASLAKPSEDLAGILKEQFIPLLETMSSMIYKEENILFPMALERLSHEEWLAIKQESHEIGYALIEPADEWPIDLERISAEGEQKSPTASIGALELAPADGEVRLDTGVLTLKELNLMLTHLPVDITFVDKDDVVRYFSAGKDRIFVRAGAVIGRNVKNCHPPKSVHVVEQIVNDFKAGSRDHADFWIQMGEKFVHIRYFAVRDDAGEYVGALEMTQDIAPLRELEGERRLLSAG